MKQVKVIMYETFFSDDQQIQVNMLSQTQIDEYAEELAITTIAKSKNATIDLTNIRCKSLPEIPDTTKYLYLNSTKIQEIDRELPNLHILSMPCTPLTQIKTLPPTLLKLFINNTRITELPYLPPRLTLLHAYSTKLKKLPKLPSTLEELWVNNTQITDLPDLPNNLRVLWVYNTFLEDLPPLPETLYALQTHGTEIIKRKPEERMGEYIQRANLYYERKRAHDRLERTKEALMEQAWHPRRISRWLEETDEETYKRLIGEDS